MIRRALSSESGFLGFLDLGLGFVGLPSLRENGSGRIEQCMCMGILGFVVGNFGRGSRWVVEKKVDLRLRDSIFVLSVCFHRK